MGLTYIEDFPPKNETTRTSLLNKLMISGFILTCFNGVMQLDKRHPEKGIGN